MEATVPALTASWPARHRWAPTLAVGAGHAVLLWALVHLGVVQRAVQQAAPLTVQIVRAASDTEPPVAALPPSAVPVLPPAAAPLSAPVVDVQAVQEVPPTSTAPTAPPQTTVAPAVASPRAEPAPAAPPPRLQASALRYRVEPPVQVPRLSRRAGESGTVLLHVVVDVNGVPAAVSLKRSSGFARLDEQALFAMRQARFVPCTADGRPVECESDAPIVYELEH